jgi:uncharacterized protein (TIGR00251 family)
MSPPPAWLLVNGDGSVTLSLHIQPGAKKTEVVGQHGEALKIRLAAPPVDGKANAALCAFLAQLLKLPKKQITLVSGETARSKRIRLTGLTPLQREQLERHVHPL